MLVISADTISLRVVRRDTVSVFDIIRLRGTGIHDDFVSSWFPIISSPTERIFMHPSVERKCLCTEKYIISSGSPEY